MEGGVASPIVLTGHPPVVASVLESAVVVLLLGARWKKDPHPDALLVPLLVVVLASVLECLTGHPDEVLVLLLIESVMLMFVDC
jgi:hypothetical protein